MSSNVLTSDILVLGAGMGGVSAAKTLSDLGIKNMIVLEGSDRFLHLFLKIILFIPHKPSNKQPIRCVQVQL